MEKIWKFSKWKPTAVSTIPPLESKDLFIQDFSIQKEKLMKTFLKSESLDSAHLLNPYPSEEKVFKIDPKELLIEYSKIHELKLISIGLASPEKIQQWAEKMLPNGKILGEVTNANTLHYKTFKPTKGGLFCERIFGPLKDFECSCGIRQRPNQQESKQIFNHLQMKRKFCSVCDVEYTWSVIRRYQLGYIRLVSPVSHLWYLRANPSYLAILLDLKRKKLENIVYCSETTTLENHWKSSQSFGFENSPTFLYLSWQQTLENEDLETRSFPKKLAVSKPLNLSICPKRVENREKQLTADFLTETTVHSDNLQNKLELKLKKRFIPTIWVSIWKRIFKDSYIRSIQQNAKIWSLLWAKYKMKSLNTLPTTLKNQMRQTPSKHLFLEKKNNFSNLSFQKRIPPNNLFFTLKQSDPYLQIFQNYEKNISQNTSIFNISMTLQQPSVTTKTTFLSTVMKEQRRSSWTSNWKMLFSNQLNSLSNPASVENRLSSLHTTLMLFFLNWLQSNSNFVKIVTLWTRQANGVKPQNQNQKLKHFIKQYLQSEESQKTSSVKLFHLYLFYLTKLQLKNALVLNQMSLKHIRFDSLTRMENFQLTKNTSRLLKKKFKVSQSKRFHAYYPVIQLFSLGYKDPQLFEGSSQNSLFLNETFTKEKMLATAVGSFATPSVNLKQQLKIYNNQKSIQSEKANFYSQRKNFQTQNRLSKSKWRPNSSYWIRPESQRLSGFPQDQRLSGFPQGTDSAIRYVNNIYCLSYAYSWDLERDWKYFFYAMSAPLAFEDSQIPCYTHRTPNISDFSSNPFVTGAGLIQQLLKEFQPVELKKMSKQHRILLPKIRQKIRKIRSTVSKQGMNRWQTPQLSKTQLSEIEKLLKKRDHIMKRFKILRKMLRKNTNPSSMVLSNLPVLPPDLRPILKLQDQIAASDLNTLYQRILFRNDRLKKFLKDPAISQSFESKYAQRLLQEAVDNLIQNGKGSTKPETNSRGQPLKSLSEILKGKQGRFRQYLLGKRVDYSGRSVIVVGPQLKLHECGLPKEMAIELFLPFLIKKILHYGLAATILGAKTLIQKKDPMIWDLLRETLRNHPVLLNRAPTLHRLGIQAFQPKLVEGRAILIHPLVCPGFNADFDGDQMAVHVPITIEARIEAWKLIFSGNNLISAATGEPIVLPSQDMVLGLYYLTAEKVYVNQIQKRKQIVENTNPSFYDFRAKNFMCTEFLPTDYCFSNCQQVLQAYQLKSIHAHSVIWLKWNGAVETKSNLSIPEEIQLNESGSFEEIRTNVYRRFNSRLILIHQFVRTTPGRVFLNLRIQQYF